MIGSRSFTRAALVLAILPSLAVAQRGMTGGRGMGGGRGGGIARDPGLEIPKLVNGVNLLIEHRQELALTDSQFVHVIAVKRGLDSTNAPLMRSLDSVQHLFKGGSLLFGGPSPERRDSLNIARHAIAETQAAIRENISEWRQKAYALLSYSQTARAQDIEDKAAKALADDTKGRGRGGG